MLRNAKIGNGRPTTGKAKKRTKQSRRKAANRAGPLPPLANCTDVRCRKWKTGGVWSIDTCNANCLNTAEQQIFPGSSADVTLVQETKVVVQEQIDAAQTRLRQAGWNAHLQAATRGEGGNPSAGCAVSVRKGIGLVPNGKTTECENAMPRLAAAWVSAVCRGGICVVSIYLKDSVGPDDFNLKVLHEAASFVNSLEIPWIIAGDWNMEPSSFAGPNWLELVKGKIMAPASPTCNKKTYDYFVVCSGARSC